MTRRRPSTAAGHTTRKYVQDVETRAIPKALALYNNYMGGVDLAGQLASYYRIWLRGLKWWHALLWWLLNQCITQAWIIHREVLHRLGDSNKRPYTHWEFQRKLAEELVKLGPNFGGSSDPSMMQSISKCPGARICKVPECVVTEQDRRKRCQVRPCGPDNRGRKTTWMCSDCGKPFCNEHLLEHIQWWYFRLFEINFWMKSWFGHPGRFSKCEIAKRHQLEMT